MPFVFVRFEQFVGLFVGEEVEDQGAQRRRRADLLVQDASVAGSGDGIGCFAEPRDGAEDVVAQGRCEDAVAEAVQFDEEEVLGTSGVVAQIAIHQRIGLHELLSVH